MYMNLSHSIFQRCFIDLSLNKLRERKREMLKECTVNTDNYAQRHVSHQKKGLSGRLVHSEMEAAVGLITPRI